VSISTDLCVEKFLYFLCHGLYFVSFLHFNKKPIEADIGCTKYVTFLGWFVIRNDNF
jgi:hypothetical protein